MISYKSNGKLLLTGEYVVLDGALSLALPTKLGQSLHVAPSKEKGIRWRSLTNEKSIWFEEKLFQQSTNPIAQTLEKILLCAKELNPDFLSKDEGLVVETILDFPQNWGLGSSSTLIDCIAQWAKVNPYKLLFDSFGGSGYDIACARAHSPILYQLNNSVPKAYPIGFQPPFSDKLFFVHLNKKQNSREGISQYRKFKKSKSKIIEQITEITENILRNPSESAFCELLKEHEEIISQCINTPPVQTQYFPDFEGVTKSLGAWGGDFILAVGKRDYVYNYFISKGFETILPFKEIILDK